MELVEIVTTERVGMHSSTENCLDRSCPGHFVTKAEMRHARVRRPMTPRCGCKLVISLRHVEIALRKFSIQGGAT